MRLVVQTSSAGFVLGLMAADGAILREARSQGRAPQSRNIGDLFQSLLRDQQLAAREIEGILVDLGPGGLSSTRAGVSFANALAFGTGTPLFGVSALDLLRIEARSSWEGPLVCMRPAQGGLVFWTRHDAGSCLAHGCDRPEIALDGLADQEGAVIGPLARLRLAPPAHLRLLDVDPPGLWTFAQATLRAPTLASDIQVLEPITSAAGLVSA